MLITSAAAFDEGERSSSTLLYYLKESLGNVAQYDPASFSSRKEANDSVLKTCGKKLATSLEMEEPFRH